MLTIPSVPTVFSYEKRIAGLQFPPPFDVVAVGFQMMPGEIFDQSRNTHPSASQSADDLVQSVAHLAAHEDGFAVLNFRHSEKCLSVFLQCRFLLFHSDTVG